MSNLVVVDASVWVSWLMPLESSHSSTDFWMGRFIARGGRFVVPSFLLIEIAASIARQTGQKIKAKEAIESLSSINTMQVLPTNEALTHSAIDVAIDLQLRAGDAIYVALAHQLNIPLVSWDKEQILKASQIIAAYTPESYPFSGEENHSEEAQDRQE